MLVEGLIAADVPAIERTKTQQFAAFRSIAIIHADNFLSSSIASCGERDAFRTFAHGTLIASSAS